MIYQNFQDLNLSALGFGTMRLSTIGGKDAEIDEAATAEMVDYALAHGVNYFDTAWGYHDGNSETVVGKALAKHPREDFYLATKFPGYDLRNMGKTEEIFEQQLKKCGVDYFDFYLVHNVCELNIDAYLDESYGTMQYLRAQKANGRIRHLGFSAHGSVEVMERFLQAYGSEMEFCQIQLNYVDWSLQDAKSKFDLLVQREIPVWVMEPLRGGKLAQLEAEDEAALRALRPEERAPAWAFRFLQSLPQVTVTLSGMSNFAQVKENIETYAQARPLSETEQAAVLELAERMIARTNVPCTDCKYCISHCPKSLNIPYFMSLYNEHVFTGGGFIAPMALAAIPREKRPSACVGCASCEAVCPQQIKISDILGNFSQKLR